ncbi:MAG TPA: response regulator [Bacteroidales bacterium]|nr:response regulator [Bacteroidales bacterium]
MMEEQNNSKTVTPSILIVDDNPQNLEVLGKILHDNNYDVEFAMSGEAAMEWIENKLFDLILLDINMPGISGFEVCVKIRLNPALDRVPVFFVSAENDRKSILKGFEYGAQDYITKPFDSRELLMRVKTHLSLKESIEKLEYLNRSLEKIVEQRTLQLKEANDRLTELNNKLIDLDKEKSEFLNLISHQIRTPLNGIIVPLELLKGPVYAREIGELVELLDVSVKRLEDFAIDALLITRLKTNPDIKKEAINISDIISEILKDKKIISAQKGKEIVFNSKGEYHCISGEYELIKKCLINILIHLLTFSNEGEVIRIRVYTEKENVICEIISSHSTISGPQHERLFDLFTSYDDHKDSYTGVNLPVAKMILDAHKGTICVENMSNAGGSIKIILKNSNKI